MKICIDKYHQLPLMSEFSQTLAQGNFLVILEDRAMVVWSFLDVHDASGQLVR
jgi:hypothetical protein